WMKRKFLVWAGGVLGALLVVGALGASVAYADDATPPAPPAGALLDGGGRHGGRGLPQAELEAAAKVLRMTTDELSTALQNGQTLEDLATTAGVDIADVRDAINTMHRVEMRTRIQQAVTDGTMTQDKADWLLEGLDKGYLDRPGFGFGFGPHGPGGPDGTLPAPSATTPAAPASSS
ncbi:MAG: hypothetical protein ACM3QS_18060, partial [Bacteroidota bacterium]